MLISSNLTGTACRPTYTETHDFNTSILAIKTISHFKMFSDIHMAN